MPVQRKNVTFPAGEIQLEGMVGYDRNTEAAPGVVICHPHPQMGGSMDNNVVHALFDAFVQRGYVCLAFNFRGAGRSGGSHEGGEGEMKDVEGALNWLKSFERTKDCDLGLLGYSFGGWVGLQTAVRLGDRIACAGAIAPPLAMYSFDFIDQYMGHFFFVLGDQDPFCPLEKEHSLLSGPEGKREGKVIAGADHFFWGREKEAALFLCERFLKALPLPEKSEFHP